MHVESGSHSRKWFSILRDQLRDLDKRALLFSRIEWIFAGLLIASSVAVFFAHLLPACRGSLWGDEIYTVSHFSERGPLKVITDYSKPNNHVFFNLLNSVQPFGDPYRPLVARFFSFAIMAAGLASLFFKRWSRLEFKEAGIVSCILFTNSEILDLCFQARGYGWIFGSALIISLQIVRYYDTGERACLVWIGAFTVMGTYTLPTFIFFAGSALLLMFLFTPRKEIFYTGLIALFLISLLYLPLAFQILKVFTKYDAGGRKAFADFNQLGNVVKNFFFDSSLPGVFVVSLLLWVAPWATVRPGRKNQSYQILALAMVTALAVSLLMETAKARTLVYIAIPCALSVILYWRMALEKLSFKVLQTSLFCSIALCGIGKNINHARTYDYEPLDDWVTLGKMISQLQSPKSFVFMQKDSYLLKHYLRSSVQLTSKFDPAAFSRGELACVASDISTSEPINREADLTTNYPSAFVLLSHSKRAGSFPLWSVIPETRMIPDLLSGLTKISDNRVFDRNPKTGVPLSSSANGSIAVLDFRKIAKAHSLFVIFGQDILPEDIFGELCDESGKSIHTAKILNSGRVVCIPLGSPEISSVKLSFSSRIKNLQLNETWAVLEAEKTRK